MSLQINLGPTTESLLRDVASREGVEPAEYARRLVEGNLLAAQLTVKQQALIALFDSANSIASTVFLTSVR